MKTKIALILILIIQVSGFSLPLEFTDNHTEESILTINLEDAINLALDNSIELRYALYNQKIAQANLRIGYRQFLPELSVGINQNDSVNYNQPDSHTKQLSLGIQQLIFDAGRLSAGIENQRNQIHIDSLNLELSREELVFTVIKLYIDLINYRQKKAIQQETYNTALIQYEIAKEEFNLGMITELDYFDIDLSMKNLEIELEATEQEERLILFKFARILGYEPESPIPVPAGYINPDYTGFITETNSEYWLELAREESLEFISRRFQVSALSDTLQNARFSWLPEISLKFTLTLSGDEYPLTEPGFSLGVNFNFAIPTFPITASTTIGKRDPDERSRSYSLGGNVADNLQEVYSIRVAKLNLAQAANELIDFETDFRFNIQESLINLDNHQRMLNLLFEKLEIEEKRVEIQKLKLELGEIQRIDYLKSEIKLSQLKIELLSNLVTLFTQEVSLLRMSGMPHLIETYSYIITEEEIAL
jgi:outer membrane protein TolC